MKKFTLKALLMAAALGMGGNVWADTETVTVLSENYESYATGDITATMQTNGWTFQSKNGKNEIKIVQGATDAVNATKYFDFYYPDGGANRNQSWNMGISSSLTADNWTLTFSAALNPGTNNSANVFYITGTKSGQVTSAYNPVTNSILKLAGTAAAAVTYVPTIGSTSYDQITLASGTWYNFTIQATSINSENNTANLYVKIASFDNATTVFEQTIENMNISSIGTLQGICWNSPRGYSRLSLDNVLVTKEVDAGECAEPTINVTGVNGTSRIFTLACETAGSTIYYATSELEKGAEGWTTYASAVSTEYSTIYAYAERGTVTSNIVSLATGAGTAVALNAPWIFISDMVANGSVYNAVLNGGNDQSSVSFSPTATQTATFTPDGGVAKAVTLPFTVEEDGILTITVEAVGYTSASTSVSVSKAYAKTWQSLDFSSLVGIDAVQTALGTGWTLQDGHGRWASWNKDKDGQYNFYQHGSASGNTITINKNIRMRDVVLLAEGMGLGRNVTGEAIAVSNTVAGQVVAFEIYNGYGNDINKGVNTYKTYVMSNGTENPSMSSNSGALLVQATIYSPAVSKSISAAGYATLYSDKALDFSSTGLTAYIAKYDDTEYKVTFEEVTSVPANTGVLLKGAEGNYAIPVVASSATDVAGNVFVGVTEETNVAAGIFVLLNGDQGVGFYQTTNAFTVGANTAYIAVPIEVKARFIGVEDDDDATAITAIEATEAVNNGVIYNLSGQRVVKPLKGIYIQNGKKFIVK